MSRRTTKQRRAARRREEAIFQAQFGNFAGVHRSVSDGRTWRDMSAADILQALLGIARLMASPQHLPN